MCLVFEHFLNQLDYTGWIKNRFVLFVDPALDHFQVKLVIHKALEQVRLEVEQLELLFHPAFRHIAQVDTKELTY